MPVEVITFDQPATPTPEEPVLLRSSEAAALLNISERHLYDLAKEGTIPCVRLGRSVRFRRSAILRFVEQHEQ